MSYRRLFARALPLSLGLLVGGCSLIAAPDESLLTGSSTSDAVSSSSDATSATSSSTSSTSSSGGAGGAMASSSSISVGGAGGAGGSGGGMPCFVPADCDPILNPCVARTCDGGVCGSELVMQGTAIPLQLTGDCQSTVCDGQGATENVDDNADVENDGLFCTDDSCDAGSPVHMPKNLGTTCGNGATCDANGQCIGCTLGTDCMGSDSDCQTRTCNGGVCGMSFAGNGTPTSMQTLGDCKQNQCDGQGAVVSVNTNDPQADANQCTGDTCNAGTNVHDPLAAMTACNQMGGTKCDGMGACVQCLMAGECGTNTECKTFSCMAGGCQQANTMSGFVTAGQTPGDCKQNQCDGAGNIGVTNFNADVPVDGKVCTSDVCTNGAPSNPPLMAGTSCGPGTDHCDGMGNCIQCAVASDCGVNTECKTFSCVNNSCMQANAPPGTVTPTQSLGDCKENRCDASGNVVNANQDLDTPFDNDQCTDDVCSMGVGSNPDSTINSPCGSGDFCDGGGTCVDCNVGGQCPSGVCTGQICQAPACNDTVKNGTETGVDCGGPMCLACPNGQGCSANADCTSQNCVMLVCQPAAAPTVVSTTPADGATGVDPLTTISITFSTAMNASTLTTETALSAGLCTGTVQISMDNFASCLPLVSPVLSAGNTVLTLTPAPALSFTETYKIKVTTGAQSSVNVGLASDFTTPTGFKTKTPATPTDGLIVISQVYGGGGNTGAVYKNDFIELHNRGATPVDVTGWSVQYAGGSAMTPWEVTALTGIIPAGGYYLVQEAAGANMLATPLPTPDATGMSAMGGTNGKVALVMNTTPLTGACPGGTVNQVGYGTSNCSETAPVPTLSNANSGQRKSSGCTDTGSNLNDFTVAAAAPRNSMTPAVLCNLPDPINETGFAAELDFCNVQFPTSETVNANVPTQTIYCQVYELGKTEAAGAAAGYTVELGYGPRTTNPEDQAGWLWQTMVFNTNIGDNDEYMSTLTVPTAGSYSYACRVTDTTAATKTYCDLNGAGSNSSLFFETNQLPLLTVN